MRQAWVDRLAAPLPERIRSWLIANSSMVYYQDWGWYPDREGSGPEESWASVRDALTDALDEASLVYDELAPNRLEDLAEVATRWSESSRVVAAGNRVADQVSAFNLWQVPAFMTDEHGSRREVLARFEAAIADDTRVVVAHSLGSVVAYEAIHRLDVRLDALVTLGSPLGVSGYVYDRLKAAGFPPTVDNWINIAHPDEPVALVPELAPLFPDADGQRRVDDRLLSTGQPYPWHAVDDYLAQDPVRSAVWTAIDAMKRHR